MGTFRHCMGPRPDQFFLFFREFGPLHKNSGLNPMRFQFLGGGTLGPPKAWAPPGRYPGYASGSDMHPD